jgi:hypothetical protein
VLERQVQADADQGRAEDDGDDLGLERGVIPGVGGQLGAADVAFF